jgi:hypothetical protein
MSGNRRLFSDEFEESIVREIAETFWNEERKISRRTLRGFLKSFWLTYCGEGLQARPAVISNRFWMLFCWRGRLPFRKEDIFAFRSRQDQEAVESYVRAVKSAVARLGAARVVNMDEISRRDVQTRGKS